MLHFTNLSLNSLPSNAKKSSPGSRMRQAVAIARAVLILSPVTIRTVMPARLHFSIAAGTSGRTGSLKIFSFSKDDYSKDH